MNLYTIRKKILWSTISCKYFSKFLIFKKLYCFKDVLVFCWCFKSLWHFLLLSLWSSFLLLWLLLLSFLLFSLLLLFQYYYYYYCYNNNYYSTVLGMSTANFEPIILPSKKNQWKSSSKENLFESYLQLFTTWFPQKYFLQSFNVLIEIQCLILPHKFLLQWYTQKGIILASFRFVSDSVTRLSSPGLCTPPQELKR